jgi:hypothetical protein
MIEMKHGDGEGAIDKAEKLARVQVSASPIDRFGCLGYPMRGEVTIYVLLGCKHRILGHLLTMRRGNLSISFLYAVIRPHVYNQSLISNIGKIIN